MMIEEVARGDLQMAFEKLIALLLIALSSVYTFTPEVLQLNHRIAQLEQRNRELAALRNASSLPLAQPLTASAFTLPQYSTSQLRFNSVCNHTGDSITGFLFQTITNVYFAINYPQTNSIRVYSHRCEELSMLEGVQIKQVLCDRGVCQAGTLHFLGSNNCLYSAAEDKNFTSATVLTDLGGARIVGGVVRNRGKDKVEIYLAEEEGAVRVLDESGVGKLRMALQGFNSRLLTMKDHHPYPLLLTQDHWISLLDTAKYAELAPNCPHIPHLQALLAQNYYGQASYALTPSAIYLLDFELSKKNCQIKRHYQLQAPLDSTHSLSFFSNCIFADNRVYNITEKRLYQLDALCTQASLTFIYRKSQPQEIYALKRCCTREHCSMEFYEVKRAGEDRSILFWLTLAFIAVLFLSISFMKKSTVNNLDLDDPTKIREREVQQQIMALTQQAKLSKQKKPPSKPSKKQA